MKIDFKDIVINPAAYVEYGFGEYGIGVYFYSFTSEIIFFIPEKIVQQKIHEIADELNKK